MSREALQKEHNIIVGIIEELGKLDYYIRRLGIGYEHLHDMRGMHKAADVLRERREELIEREEIVRGMMTAGHRKTAINPASMSRSLRNALDDETQELTAVIIPFVAKN